MSESKDSREDRPPNDGHTASGPPASPGFLTRARTIRDQPGWLETLAFGILCIAIVLGIWHLLTLEWEGGKRIIKSAILPSIPETLRSFPSLWYDRALARSAFWSLGRVMGGFLLGASIAIPLGITSGSYLRFNAFLRPMSIFGRNVPIAALIPLTVIWFDIGEIQKVMFILLASVSFVYFDTTHAVEGVSSRYLDTAYTLGARRKPKRGLIVSAVIGIIYAAIIATFYLTTTSLTLSSGALWIAAAAGWTIGFLLWLPIQSHQVLYKVVLPLALPAIINSLRLLFGLAFGYIMLAEAFIFPDYGLGKILVMSQRRAQPEHIYLSLVFIATLAFTIDRIIYWLQRKWFPYRDLP